jgi:hypothetical protein
VHYATALQSEFQVDRYGHGRHSGYRDLDEVVQVHEPRALDLMFAWGDLADLPPTHLRVPAEIREIGGEGAGPHHVRQFAASSLTYPSVFRVI